jgi:hypothetical protein
VVTVRLSTAAMAEVSRRAYAARRLLADAVTVQTIDVWAEVKGAYLHLLVIEELMEALGRHTRNLPDQ